MYGLGRKLFNHKRDTISFFFDRKFSDWISKKIPAREQIRLNKKNIFILPSKYGFVFLIVAAAVFLSGVNYSNNLMLLLSFLLISLFTLSVVFTFRNLSGLVISASETEGCFVGEQAMFRIVVERDGDRCYENIRLYILDTAVELVNLFDQREQTVELLVDATARGYLNPGRITVETIFPLGFFKAWSWIDLNMKALIFPKPIECQISPSADVKSQSGPIANPHGADDFYGLKRYTPGDPISHCCWKSLSRGQPLTTKEFVNPVDSTISLRLSDMPASDIETKLGNLCYWVIKSAEQSQFFSLDLGDSQLTVGNDPNHTREALSRLAFYRALQEESLQ